MACRKIWKLVTFGVVAAAATAMWIAPASADPTHPSTVTIDVRPGGDGKFIVSGVVKSPKEGCRARRRVFVWRKVAGPDQKHADTLTELDGKWEARGARVDPGTYYAKIEKDRRGEINTGRFFCLADRSPDVKAG